MADEKFFHREDHHIWTYCVHLGPYEGDRKYDLGVYDDGRGSISLAAVYGENDSEYRSGEMVFRGEPTGFMQVPVYQEAYRRYLKHLGGSDAVEEIETRRAP